MYDLDADPGYREIPQLIMDALMDWAETTQPPGGFLTAVLENNLIEAVCLADADSLRHLRAIVKFVYNQMPSGCHAMRSRAAKADTVMGDWQRACKQEAN